MWWLQIHQKSYLSSSYPSLLISLFPEDNFNEPKLGSLWKNQEALSTVCLTILESKENTAEKKEHNPKVQVLLTEDMEPLAELDSTLYRETQQ